MVADGDRTGPRFAAGRFTPSDALSSVLERLQTVNPVVNAVVALDRSDATAAAARSTVRWREGVRASALDGVPVSVKYNLFVTGMRATWGSRLHEGRLPAQDEPAVVRLRRAGCVLFSKTNVPEFTVQGFTSNLLFGTTRNPHALDRTPGGSTGDGAAAVASGMGPLAIGTDSGGSLRRPAAHCGLFAFKPSIGQIARYGRFPPILGDFEVIGAVARSVQDLQATAAILAGHDPADPRSLAAKAALPAFPAAPRVAFLPRIGSHPVDPGIAAAADRMARAIAAAGLSIKAIEVPYDPEAVASAWDTVAGSGLAWHLAKSAGWQEQVNPKIRAMAEIGGQRTASDLLDALAVAAQVRQAAAALFSQFDLLLCPAAAALAWAADDIFPAEIDGRPVGPRGYAVFTGRMNVAGLPAATVPVAMTPDDGGIGVQFVAAHGRDHDLLAFIQTLPLLSGMSPAALATLNPPAPTGEARP